MPSEEMKTFSSQATEESSVVMAIILSALLCF